MLAATWPRIIAACSVSLGSCCCRCGSARSCGRVRRCVLLSRRDRARQYQAACATMRAAIPSTRGEREMTSKKELSALLSGYLADIGSKGGKGGTGEAKSRGGKAV